MRVKIAPPQNIRYNAVTNMFEALVTVTTPNAQFRYPCSVQGSLMMRPAAAAFKLSQQAKEQHQEQSGLRACLRKTDNTCHESRERYAA